MNNQNQVPDYMRVRLDDIVERYRKQVDSLLYSEMIMQQQMDQMQKVIDTQRAKLKENGISNDNSNNDDDKQQNVKLPK